jgi:aerobic carbon-monoxide dehydrogenase large subunit
VILVPDTEFVGRLEDRRLLTGKGHFVDDMIVDKMAYMGFVRSPYAHATVRSIDLSKLKTHDSCIASLTGEDLTKENLAPVSQNPWPPQKRAIRYQLAVGKVRFVGEPVVAILSKDKNALEDLIEEVKVEYEPLPTVTTLEESKQGKAILYQDWKDNLSMSSEIKQGDVDGTISRATYVINFKEGIGRQESAPIEPHGVLVSYDEEKGSFEVHAAVQSVHGLQGNLSSELRIPKEKIHVITLDVGGGFGSKGAQSYPEPVVACLFARKTGLSIKWTATRTEDLEEAASGRDEYCDLTLACDSNGKIVALRAMVECDAGVGGTQNHMSGLSLATMLGPYGIPNRDLRVAVYVTNKMPLGPVRGAGAPEGCFFIERAMDVMARKIGLDPMEFRRRNLLQGSDKDSEDYGALFDILINASGYEDLLRWKQDLLSKFRRQESNVIGGVGISVRGLIGSPFGQGSGASGATSRQASSWRRDGVSAGESSQTSGQQRSTGAWTRNTRDNEASQELSFMSESAKITVRKGGKVIVYTGSSPHGQGEETTFAQLTSEELHVPPENVTVVWGDTALIPRGIGTFGSRSGATGGSAVVDAARKLNAKILQIASESLGVVPSSIILSDGISVCNSTEPYKVLLTLDELLQKMGINEISAESVFTLQGMSYSSGVHLCVLTLDVDLCSVKIAKYLVVEDPGRVINKTIVDGQLEGGVVHGIGGSLFERVEYDKAGKLLTTNFASYAIPTALDTPDITIIHSDHPSSISLDGSKGVGESGTIASYGAVMNALNDALRQINDRSQCNIAPALPSLIHATLTS